MRLSVILVVGAAALALAPSAGGAQGSSTPAHEAAPRAAQAPHAESPAPPKATPAEQWFARLKSLAGGWTGRVVTDPHVPEMAGADATVTLRVTSMGNAIMHNMRNSRLPDDPITMIYLEDGRLLLTHYCDAGNRPRMEGTMSPDGKSVTFEFVDLVGPTKYGHMNRAVFTFVDDGRHVEEWTYMLPDSKAVHATFELRRAPAVGGGG